MVDVVVVTEHELLAELLAIGLGGRGVAVHPCVRPARADDVRRLVAAVGAEVAVVEVTVGGDVRQGTSALLGRLAPAVPTVVLTGIRSEADLGGFHAAGVVDVVSMTADVAALATTLRAAVRRLPTTAEEVRRQRLVAHQARVADATDARSAVARLTTSEREVLAALAAGARPTDVAAARHVSLHTVRSQVKSILTKLEVASQLAAVAIAHRAALTPHTP